MRFVLGPAIAGVCALLWALGAGAQAVDEPLDLAAAIQRALAQQPALAGFVFELRAQEARVAEAGLRPATQVDLLVEDAGGTGERRGFSAAQTTLSLSHLIELGGKREGRIAVAEATQAQLKTAQAALQLDVVAEVARRFIDTVHQQARLHVAQQDLQLAQRMQEAVARRVRAARAPTVEVARSEVRVSQAHLEIEHAEHELQSSRRFLAAAMGERQVRFGEALGDLYTFAPVVAFDDLAGRIDSSPEFLQFADEARVRDAELRLVELRRRPDVRTQLGVRHYDSGDDVALIAGFSVPLGSARRAQSAIDRARAQRARTDAEREAAFLKVQAQLFAQYQALEHARLEANTLRERVIPQLERALQMTESAYQRGRYSYLEWTDAQRELLAARRRLTDVAATFHTLSVEIERLTGQSLETMGAMR